MTVVMHYCDLINGVLKIDVCAQLTLLYICFHLS